MYILRVENKKSIKAHFHIIQNGTWLVLQVFKIKHTIYNQEKQ